MFGIDIMYHRSEEYDFFSLQYPGDNIAPVIKIEILTIHIRNAYDCGQLSDSNEPYKPPVLDLRRLIWHDPDKPVTWRLMSAYEPVQINRAQPWCDGMAAPLPQGPKLVLGADP